MSQPTIKPVSYLFLRSFHQNRDFFEQTNVQLTRQGYANRLLLSFTPKHRCVVLGCRSCPTRHHVSALPEQEITLKTPAYARCPRNHLHPSASALNSKPLIIQQPTYRVQFKVATVHCSSKPYRARKDSLQAIGNSAASSSNWLQLDRPAPISTIFVHYSVTHNNEPSISQRCTCPRPPMDRKVATLKPLASTCLQTPAGRRIIDASEPHEETRMLQPGFKLPICDNEPLFW